MSPILQEKKRNNLRDFLNVAGPMGVTHFLILSKTAASPYLRVATTPQGPTLTFKIHEYSLAADIARSQLHPRCPKDLFKNSALVKYFFSAYNSLDNKKMECQNELLFLMSYALQMPLTQSPDLLMEWEKIIIYYVFTFYSYQVEDWWDSQELLVGVLLIFITPNRNWFNLFVMSIFMLSSIYHMT